MLNKPYYEDYANHAFRFYIRNPVFNPGSMSKASCEMWKSCDEVMNGLTDKERTIMVAVFRSKKPMIDSVKLVAYNSHCTENAVWQLLNRTAKAFAEKRGLI